MSAVFPPSNQSSFAFSGPVLAPPRPSPALTYGAGGASRGTGLVIVVALHVVLGWALASGLARKAVEIVKKPIEMVIVPQEETPPPPPPPPPPKIEKIRDIPKVAPPPPAYVPPPEVVPVAPPPAPVIQAVQAEPPKEPVRIEPPPPPAPPAPPAPAPVPAPEPKPAIVKQDIGVACPGYQAVLPQLLEEAFDRVGVPGTVRVLIKVKGSQVIDAIPQSGPKEYYKYLQGAIKRSMRCSAGGDSEVQASLDVVFQK